MGNRKYDVEVYGEPAGLTEHRLFFGNDERAFTPFAGENDGEGQYGNLAINSKGGDWSWKPHCSSESTPNYTGETQRTCERQAFGNEVAQGMPRATTYFTSDGRIAQYNIAPERQARQAKTGDQPRDMPSTMKRIWDQINDPR